MTSCSWPTTRRRGSRLTAGFGSHTTSTLAAKQLLQLADRERHRRVAQGDAAPKRLEAIVAPHKAHARGRRLEKVLQRVTHIDRVAWLHAEASERTSAEIVRSSERDKR